MVAEDAEGRMGLDTDPDGEVVDGDADGFEGDHDEDCDGDAEEGGGGDEDEFPPFGFDLPADSCGGDPEPLLPNNHPEDANEDDRVQEDAQPRYRIPIGA